MAKEKKRQLMRQEGKRKKAKREWGCSIQHDFS